jgi:hypothetical protein
MSARTWLGIVVASSLVVVNGTLASARQSQDSPKAAPGVASASAKLANSTDPPKADKPATGTKAAGTDAKKDTVKPAPKPPEKVGFARVSNDWPKWLTVSLVERGRVESVRPPATKGAVYDGYYLNRFRLTAIAKATPWLVATVQTQDARVGAYAVSPAPKSMNNTFDLRVASVELGKKAPRGVSAVVGRQEMTFADGRLMASPDWGNVSRTYDGARLAAYRPGVRVEVFGAAPVDVTPDAFSRAKVGERVYGTWVTFDKVKPLAYADGYTIAKFNATATGETGTKGDQVVYTTGVRAGGPVRKVVTWEFDTAVQYGHSAADSLSAWATHEGIAWSVGKSAMKPKLSAEYNFASGDTNAKDGTKHTFDQLYVSTHAKWGLGDQIGWRNMQHVAVKFEVSPTPKLKVNTALNHLWLATVNDSWYGSSGSKVVLNKKATSRDIGWEPDLFATYTLNRDLSVGAGFAVLMAGDFVLQSTDVTRVWTPYVMWTYKF